MYNGGSMKIRVLSDLHLEVDSSFRYEYQGEDVVVLAGDISSSIVAYQEFVSDITVPVVAVPGNHESYGHEFDAHLLKLKAVGYSYNQIKVIDDVHFICGTGWTDFTMGGCISAERSAQHAEAGINDFKRIKKEVRLGLGSTQTYTRRWSTQDCILEHKKYLIFMEEALYVTREKKRVIVSHFLPLGNCIHEKYADSILNNYFASNLSGIASKYTGLWIHGHTHSSLDFMYKDTHIVCNPKGYGNENTEFNPNLIVEVDTK